MSRLLAVLFPFCYSVSELKSQDDQLDCLVKLFNISLTMFGVLL